MRDIFCLERVTLRMSVPVFAQQVKGQSLPIPDVRPGLRDNHILEPADLLIRKKEPELWPISFETCPFRVTLDEATHAAANFHLSCEGERDREHHSDLCHTNPEGLLFTDATTGLLPRKDGSHREPMCQSFDLGF